MTKHRLFRIKCDAIPYRKGFLEVTAAIHDGCVNIEAWEVAAETRIDNVSWVDDASLAESSVIANIEIELSAEQARRLGAELLEMAESVEAR